MGIGQQLKNWKRNCMEEFYNTIVSYYVRGVDLDRARLPIGGNPEGRQEPFWMDLSRGAAKRGKRKLIDWRQEAIFVGMRNTRFTLLQEATWIRGLDPVQLYKGPDVFLLSK
jgi:hypothetical protein